MSQKHILAVYNLANSAEVLEGTAWYKRANELAYNLSFRYDVTQCVAAGVIAALSPRNKWERNVADAENLIRVYCADPLSVDSVKVCTFGANKDKAIRILSEAETAEDVLAILSGPKLQEFYSCIIGMNDVCIDGHAYSIWAGDRITLANTPKIGVKLRQQIKQDYINAANEVGIAPYEMQAITWCAWRRIYGV